MKKRKDKDLSNSLLLNKVWYNFVSMTVESYFKNHFDNDNDHKCEFSTDSSLIWIRNIRTFRGKLTFIIL